MTDRPPMVVCTPSRRANMATAYLHKERLAPDVLGRIWATAT